MYYFINQINFQQFNKGRIFAVAIIYYINGVSKTKQFRFLLSLREVAFGDRSNLIFYLLLKSAYAINKSRYCFKMLLLVLLDIIELIFTIFISSKKLLKFKVGKKSTYVQILSTFKYNENLTGQAMANVKVLRLILNYRH